MSTATLVQLILAVVLVLLIAKFLRDSQTGSADTQIAPMLVGTVAAILLSIDAIVFVSRHLVWR